MLTENSFNTVISQVQRSCLNHYIELTPFSAFISIKKSLMKDKSGATILPSNSKHGKLESDFNQLKEANAELMSKLEASYHFIDSLNKVNEEQKRIISDLENKIELSQEAAMELKKVHNEMRTQFEEDKINIYKIHHLELQSLKSEISYHD